MALDHKVRFRGIGSSEIAMLMGVSRWGGPHTLWRRKTGREEEQEESPIMSRGHVIERALLDWYSSETGQKIWTPPTTQHPDHPVAVSSVDALTETQAVEAKTVHASKRREWGEPGTGDIPQYYALQCQWHCLVHDRDECALPVDFGDSLAIYLVRHNPSLTAAMVEIASEFWTRHVLADHPPPLDGDDQTNKWLSKQAQRTEQIVDATPEQIEMLLEYGRLRRSKKELEARKTELEVKIKEAIGDKEALGTKGKVLVTHRQGTRGRRLSCTGLDRAMEEIR